LGGAAKHREGEAGLTRRRLLGSAGAAGLAMGAGAAGGYLVGRDDDGEGTGTVPFFGEHQAGIVTPAQDRLAFGAFDLVSDDPTVLRELLRDWSDAAARITAGAPAGPENAAELHPPDDTGETVGLLPARLTVTFGLGPGVFAEGRLGLDRLRPPALRDPGPLPAEALQPARSGGDLCVQACADDPQVAFHALRNLTRIGRGRVVLRWSQLGFGRTATTSREQETPRNLMGFKDGTNNLRAEDTDALAEHVWLDHVDGAGWAAGGTIMVTRRIRMLLEVWDRATLADQELTIGRRKESGAPLGGDDELDPVDLEAGPADDPVVPVDAHVRLSAPAANGGAAILRRGYSFADGVDEVRGQLDAGLFFICFQRDPRRQFAAIQQRLGADALNEYIEHTSSAVFLVPPGAREGGFVGEPLFAAAPA
jgi:deferrochelatase/peroxidase EfeB